MRKLIIINLTLSLAFQEVPLQVRVSILQQRLGLPEDTPLEFVNGGHGIKNPLVNHERQNEAEKPPPTGNF